jgi:hypothetical protein
MRGLAYDAAADTYFAGTWNGNFVVEFDSDGAILRSKVVDLPISGLAFNPKTGHLFAQVSATNTYIYVLDTKADFKIVGAFLLKDSGGIPAYPSGGGAGLEMDCAGTLWSVNQSSGIVFANQSGETDTCVGEIPWLSENPTSGTVPAGSSLNSALTFTATGLAPGCREAQLDLLNGTPYGPSIVPVGLTVAFNDVALGAFADKFIHGVAGAGVTAGCGAGNFCPTTGMTRDVMAIWLLRAKFGANYAPPPAIGIFHDVPPESFAADWIEQLYHMGVVAGCGGGNYCPSSIVSRQQMPIFELKTLEGTSYTPPACTSAPFGDVPATSVYCPWIKELVTRGVVAGCGGGNYCPTGGVNRAQMSVFTSMTYGIPQCKQ